MITEQELEEFLLGKFSLSIGQEITGLDLWNHLIQNRAYQKMVTFLGMETRETLSDSLISDDGITRSFFNQDLQKLEERQYKKIFSTYKISSVKIISTGTNPHNEKQMVIFYGRYRIARDTKWSAGRWVLFSMMIE